MKKGMIKQGAIFMLCLSFLLSSAGLPFTAFAAEKQTASASAPETTGEETTETASSDSQEETTLSVADAKKTLEEQQADLEQKMQEAEAKLTELEQDSKVTQDYIDTLDQKIGYINEQLTLLEEQVTQTQSEIDELQLSIDKNQEELDELLTEVEKMQEELNKLNEQFETTYEAYCYRLKAMYISGEYSIITALLTCNDISSFFTRFQMIKMVSKSDTELLQEVNRQTDEIITKKDGLAEQSEKLSAKKEELDAQKAELLSKQEELETKQNQIAKNKVTLANDRAESDALLAELTGQNQMYTEYRNEDEELIAAVEQEIQELISGIKTPEEVTTAAASEDSGESADSAGSTQSDVYSHSDAVLNMTYPAPGHYSVSAGYPNYSSGKYHGGIDFPCATGSKIVAAQKGIVITVKRLDYSYGYYVMIYHGTDSKGRSVVTLYAHNSSILVSVGETVTKGQQIAKSGSTGNSTGPHCHFEIRFNGTRANPKNYLSK